MRRTTEAEDLRARVGAYATTDGALARRAEPPERQLAQVLEEPDDARAERRARQAASAAC